MEQLGDLWQSFLTYLNNQPPGWIYFFLFLGAFLENVVPPIPGDTLIVFGAYLAGLGLIGVVPAYVSMYAGSAIGCLLVYGIALWKGREFFLRMEARFFSSSKLILAELWFQDHGSRIIILNRFLPTARAFVGIVAGISGIRPLRMTIYVLIGTFLWNTLLVYFGLLVGENWQLVITVLQTYNQIVLTVGITALLVYLGYRRWGRGSRDTSEAAGEQGGGEQRGSAEDGASDGGPGKGEGE